MFCSTGGYFLEVVYRSLKTKQFVNPGFLVGICLPIYGIGGVTLYYLCSIDLSFISIYFLRILFLMFICTIAMTAIEYIVGLLNLKFFKNRLWDYSNRWGNIQGLICPLFSFYWGLCCLIYYFGLFPFISTMANFVSSNIAFIFLIGLYYGVFIVDFVYSLEIWSKLRRYAINFKEHFNFETLKLTAKKLYNTRHILNNFKLSERIVKFLENRKHNSEIKLQDEDHKIIKEQDTVIE